MVDRPASVIAHPVVSGWIQRRRSGFQKVYLNVDSIWGSSVKIGKMQRRLAWPLRKDDTHKSRSVESVLKRAVVVVVVHLRDI